MPPLPSTFTQHIILAEDDEDDRFLFKLALDGLPISYTLEVVNDGEQLMQFLHDCASENLPDVLFLDLNMPRKNGFQCLSEIKRIEKLHLLKIIIFSSHATHNLEQLYQDGNLYAIRKPSDKAHFKKVIYQALQVGHDTIPAEPINISKSIFLK
ncbi:MAG: response regulator [Aquabacterium sp.]|nr:response regulator [Ferruginibacter sp.]